LFPGKQALFGELIREFSPWQPVAEVIDALPQGHPEDVMPAVAQAIAGAMHGRAGLLLHMVFELTQGDPDTVEGMRHSMARGLPDLAGYLSNQMEVGRLRRMHPILAIQLLAGPIAVHLLTQPLGDFDQSQDELLDEIAHAWLRAMAPDGS
jgi:hypothetical protein